MIQDIAPHRFDNTFIPGTSPAPDSPIYCFKEDKLLLAQETADGKGPSRRILLPRRRDFGPGTDFIRLFSLDGRDHYLACPRRCLHEDDRILPETQIDQDIMTDGGKGAQDDFLHLDGYHYERLHRIRAEGRGEKYQYFAAVTAYQLARWYDHNRFCGHCGSRMEMGSRERVMICPNCGNPVYPKIMPAVIVAVTNGDRILMTKYRNRGIGYYALVAGFVEIGETFEDTVRREVMEETGLTVKNIRYYKSQPWGIADDLLAGFYCDLDGDDAIRMDEEELSEAAWFERGQIEGQPDHLSLTNEMMLTFRDGREPAGGEGRVS